MRIGLLLINILFITKSYCNTAIPDSSSEKLELFALGARPYWQLSRALKQDTCWPSSCVENGKIVESANLKKWPVAGHGGCPDVGSSFPLYWVGKQCKDTEIRIGYDLFFKKDGFQPSGIYGHGYDWEQVIVIYNKYNNNWLRSGVYLSGHGGYTYYKWNELNTVNENNINVDGNNLDHPKIYPAWAKHSMFKEPKDGDTFFEALDAFDKNAFRKGSYQYFNNENELTQVIPNTELWNLVSNKDWNKASSSPNVVYAKLCNIK